MIKERYKKITLVVVVVVVVVVVIVVVVVDLMPIQLALSRKWSVYDND